MRKAKIPKYEDIRNSLQTFDILNCIYGFQWWNPFHWFMALIGHTAMVYRCRETGQVMVYESTQTARKDNLGGVQLRPLREWLKNYPGKVYLRHVYIDINITPYDSRIQTELLCKEHIRKYRGTAYPDLNTWKGRFFVAGASIDLKGIINDNEDTDFWFFCTMLYFDVLRWCRIMHKDVIPSEAEPDDTRSGRDSYLLEHLYDGVTVSDEIRIK